jgi:hypothetical protein
MPVAAAVGSLASFVLGSIIYEQNDAFREFALSFVGLEESFERGLDAFICGLRHPRKGSNSTLQPLSLLSTGSRCRNS